MYSYTHFATETVEAWRLQFTVASSLARHRAIIKETNSARCRRRSHVVITVLRTTTACQSAVNSARR